MPEQPLTAPSERQSGDHGDWPGLPEMRPTSSRVERIVRICEGCGGELEDDQPGPGCDSAYGPDGEPLYGPCDGRF